MLNAMVGERKRRISAAAPWPDLFERNLEVDPGESRQFVGGGFGTKAPFYPEEAVNSCFGDEARPPG